MNRAAVADAALQQAVMLTATGQLAAAEAAIAQAQQLIEHARVACLVLERHVPLAPSTQDYTATGTRLVLNMQDPYPAVAAAADDTEGEPEVTSKPRGPHVAA